MKKVAATSKWIRVRKILGYSVILMFIFMVIGILVALFLYKAYLGTEGSGAKIIGIMTALQIKVLNFVRFT